MTIFPHDPRPAWQTVELEDEWPEDDEPSASSHTDAQSTSQSQLAASGPLYYGSVNVHNTSRSISVDTSNVGTFVVRQNVPDGPVLASTPGINKNGAIKDFFSPMSLEKMFDPPSPPKLAPNAPAVPSSTAPFVPSRLSQVHVASSFLHDSRADEDAAVFDRGNVIVDTNAPARPARDEHPAMDCQFTFAAPLPAIQNGLPQAQSTPGPSRGVNAAAPATDPRLRLFQFQYDTFTRDHLSAMVDSIAVNSPSGSNTGNLTGNMSSPFGLSRVSEGTALNASDLRSAKRVKLSPVSDYSVEGGGAGIVIQRPVLRKDYVGESKSLMAQIKQARDFSAMPTVVEATNPPASRVSHRAAKHDPPAHPREGLIRPQTLQ